MESVVTFSNLGKINFKETAFHDQENLYPVGFTSSRLYWSTTDVHRRCLYVCEIISSVDGGPEELRDAVPMNGASRHPQPLFRISECARLNGQMVLHPLALADSPDGILRLRRRSCYALVTSLCGRGLG